MNKGSIIVNGVNYSGAYTDNESSIDVIDNLVNTSSEAALSAKQGKILNETKQGNLVLKGKKIGCFGDSLMYGLLANGSQSINSWVEVFGRYTESIIDNKAVPGMRISGNDLNYSFNMLVNNYNWTIYDYVILGFGANDVAQGAYIDKTHDKTQSFISAYKYVIDTILTTNPSINIILCTAPYATSMDWLYPDDTVRTFDKVTYRQINEATRRIAKSYNVILLDLEKCSGINNKNVNLLTWDGLHFTDDGYKKIGENAALNIGGVSNITEATKDSIIFISDSYGESPTYGEDWITITMSAISNPSYRNHQPGGGFGNGVFLTKLQELENIVIDKTSVKKIVVGGGFNEIAYTNAQILNGISAFSYYVSQTYPNAMICLALIGLSTYGQEAQVILRTTVVSAYKFAALTNKNITFIDNSQYINLNYRNVNIDGIHPTIDGAYDIAKGIIGYLKNGIITMPDYLGLENTITFSGACSNETVKWNWYEALNGKDIILTTLSCKINLNTPGTAWVTEIATINNPIFLKGWISDFLSFSVPVACSKDDVNFTTQTATFVIKEYNPSSKTLAQDITDGTVHKNKAKIYLTLNSYESVKQIWIPGFSYQFSTAYS